MVFDIMLLAVFLIVTWAVGSEGLWGAALMLVNVILAAILATNFWQPVAQLMEDGMGESGYWEIVALTVLFSMILLALRLVTDNIAPMQVRFPEPVFHVGRWLFAASTAWVMVCFLTMALHTAPLPRTFIGFAPERKMFFGLAPDRVWLAFFQRTTREVFDRGAPPEDPQRYVFDPLAYFLPSYASWRELRSVPVSVEAAPKTLSIPSRIRKGAGKRGRGRGRRGTPVP